MSVSNKDYVLTVILSVLIIAVSVADWDSIGPLQIESTETVRFDRDTNTIHLDSLTLKQKIGQMIVTYGKNERNHGKLQQMMIGGIHLDALATPTDFQRTIGTYQDGAVIPFFVTADLEGCRNPFESFQEFPEFREITSEEDAHAAGTAAGRELAALGFTMNFAPVVDLHDSIWNCRSFPGDEQEITAKANAYIRGLHEHGILTIAKHYPGRTLVSSDPHTGLTYATVTQEDLYPFFHVTSDGIMTTHTIVDGEVFSDGNPAILSPEALAPLREKYEGLIVTDEIGMGGLRKAYPKDGVNQMYVDLVKAGNDVLLNFDKNPKRLSYMINAIARAVENGELSEERIDFSVRKIFAAKGITIA